MDISFADKCLYTPIIESKCLLDIAFEAITIRTRRRDLGYYLRQIKYICEFNHEVKSKAKTNKTQGYCNVHQISDMLISSNSDLAKKIMKFIEDEYKRYQEEDYILVE